MPYWIPRGTLNKQEMTKSLNHSPRWRFLVVCRRSFVKRPFTFDLRFTLSLSDQSVPIPDDWSRSLHNRLHHENQRTTHSRSKKKSRFQLKIDWQSIAALRKGHTHPRTTRTNRRRDPSRSLRTVVVVVVAAAVVSELVTHTQENDLIRIRTTVGERVVPTRRTFQISESSA